MKVSRLWVLVIFGAFDLALTAINRNTKTVLSVARFAKWHEIFEWHDANHWAHHTDKLEKMCNVSIGIPYYWDEDISNHLTQVTDCCWKKGSDFGPRNNADRLECFRRMQRDSMDILCRRHKRAGLNTHCCHKHGAARYSCLSRHPPKESLLAHPFKSNFRTFRIPSIQTSSQLAESDCECPENYYNHEKTESYCVERKMFEPRNKSKTCYCVFSLPSENVWSCLPKEHWLHVPGNATSASRYCTVIAAGCHKHRQPILKLWEYFWPETKEERDFSYKKAFMLEKTRPRKRFSDLSLQTKMGFKVIEVLRPSEIEQAESEWKEYELNSKSDDVAVPCFDLGAETSDSLQDSSATSLEN